MKKGTLSLLIGVHQFIWHPITVFLAWKKLYGWPNFKTIVCIIVHDWGYWGCENMDDEKGEKHVELGANILKYFFPKDSNCYWLCLFHSRHYTKKYYTHQKPSKLCFADKLSILYEPCWFYLLRARLSGELKEYRYIAHKAGVVRISASHQEWFALIKDRLIKIGKTQNPEAWQYVNK